jgi:hypothetical protein
VPHAPQPALQQAVSICPDPRAHIVSPSAGQAVSGSVALTGTANGDTFQGYLLEYASGVNPAQGYVEFGRSLQPVSDGLLGTFEAGSLAPGMYTLVLKVIDQAGASYPPCIITVAVQ